MKIKLIDPAGLKVWLTSTCVTLLRIRAVPATHFNLSVHTQESSALIAAGHMLEITLSGKAVVF